ncbi:MAG TPA: penicillin acylase family protein [Vicinamibacterales bacterium]|nr:penicillin acylase family protein [Vicinamibacterales bacterium]
MMPLLIVLTLAVTAAQQPARENAHRARAASALSQIDGTLAVAGLASRVEVVRDRWGVPHIYASNVDDLFMAQGFVMAQDRLWQMEMWRRQKEGRLAEILGPQAVARDRAARLLRYRGPFDEREWTSYHPEGRRIVEAYARGVNAYIALLREHPAKLPIEFQLTGVRPEPWTAETVVLRTASFGDAANELRLARQVAALGREEANRRRAPDPWDDLALPPGVDLSAIDDAVIAAARAPGGAIRPALLEAGGGLLMERPEAGGIAEPGSNNWVVSGALSATGEPVVVNDPHREVTNPSLRYIVHLHAPGWNVIGGGEPPFAGVAIGHSERLAWGLTIVGTDQEDVYVERLNPANANEVRWRDRWEPLRVVTETIAVKGEAPQTIELKFSRHGPVFHEDRARGLAYALRSALLEPGTAPYLASLRLAHVRDCRAFLDEGMYWKFPSENLICGDVDGNISWLAAALTPDRRGWTGRLPVPGGGTHEWAGFRKDLPRELNPPRGFIVTANHNIQPPGYAPPIMFKSTANAAFDRITRLRQLLQPGRRYTIDDHRRMQLDAYSLRAASDVPLFQGWTSDEPGVERARRVVADWDAVFARDSAAAAMYTEWRSASTAEERAAAAGPSRGTVMAATLARALENLRREQSLDPTAWRWGRMHTRAFPHPFLRAFDLPEVERPGGSGTVAADGASFREILDVADWDRSIVTSTPGQSGQPGSPFYDNLLPLWAEDRYFPLVYSRARVDRAAAHRLTLQPR